MCFAKDTPWQASLGYYDADERLCVTLVCKVRCTGVPGQPPPSFHPQQDLRIRIAHSTTLRVVSPSLLCAILTFFTSTLHPPFIIIDNYHLAMDHFTALSARSLEARQTRRCYTTLSGRVRCRYTTSRWHNWGRWLAVALIIAAFLVGVLAFWLVLSLIAVDALRKSLTVDQLHHRCSPSQSWP